MHSPEAVRDLNRLCALVFGAAFLVISILGFAAYATGPSTGGSVHLLNLFQLNPLHNLAHAIIGAVWMISAARAESARAASQTFGLVYLVLAVLGAFQVGSVQNMLALNASDNVLHIGVGLLAVYVGFFAPHGAPEHSEQAP